MKKYKCQVCGYIYDPEVGDPDNGIEPGTAFEDLPDDWVCPLCQEGKESFRGPVIRRMEFQAGHALRSASRFRFPATAGIRRNASYRSPFLFGERFLQKMVIFAG